MSKSISVELITSYVSKEVDLTQYEVSIGNKKIRLQVNTGAGLFYRFPFVWLEQRACNGNRYSLLNWFNNELQKLQSTRNCSKPATKKLKVPEVMFITEPRQFVGLLNFLGNSKCEEIAWKAYCTEVVLELGKQLMYDLLHEWGLYCSKKELNFPFDSTCLHQSLKNVVVVVYSEEIKVTASRIVTVFNLL